MKSVGQAIIFLALAFAISWIALTIGWLRGARLLAEAQWANWGFISGPPLAALTCALAFGKGQRLRELGLAAGMNRWWFVAALLPFGASAFTLLVSHSFPAAGLPVMVDPRVAMSAVFHLPSDRLPTSGFGIIAVMACIALGFSLLFTLTEEIGWRGYLYGQLRQLGFWRCSLLTGLIWGIWHWPMVMLFGLVFAKNRLLGLMWYPLALMTLAPVMTLLRDRSGSISAPGIYHGTSNMITIVAFGAMQGSSTPGFADIALSLPMLALVAFFRRQYPNPQTTRDPAEMM